MNRTGWKATCAVALVVPYAISCLPEDTRPSPARVQTSFALGPQGDQDLGDGLSVTTTDGYEVTFNRILLSIGQVEFFGDECNSYSDAEYLRVLDGLQPGEQPLSLNYALGQCEMNFNLYPPEDWAHVENAGVSEQDRDSLRAVAFPDGGANETRRETDEVTGPRGSRGASLRLAGTAQKLESDEAPIPFLFEFATASFPPKCAPPGEETFTLQSDDDLSFVVEMHPEQLFGNCDSTELRFAAIAAAQPSGNSSEPVTLQSLADMDLAEVDDPDFYTCDRFAELGVELQFEEDQPIIRPNLRGWLRNRVSFDLFGVQDTECQWQSAAFRD